MALVKFEKSLFIFRRDLRLIDNNALIQAHYRSENVVHVFIFDPIQIDDSNKYKSNSCIYFMINSLLELQSEIHKHKGELYFLYGNPAEEIQKLHNVWNFEAVFLNGDYSPYSKKRDAKIFNWCKKNKLVYMSYHDCLLLGDLKQNKQGEYYKKFSPFEKAFSNVKINTPVQLKKYNFEKNKVLGELSYDPKKFLPNNIKSIAKGGRKEGLKLLQDTLTEQKKYNDERDQLSHQCTRLSAHNKFGTISIREEYYAFKQLPPKGKNLISQLFWRDFYYNLMDKDPNTLKSSYDPRYDNVKWNYDNKLLKAWKDGNTGYPVVDACMRQLNTEHYMHNRGRMIVATHLAKILLIDWREGEKYFAQQLVDYDPAQNNYNWQYIVGTGVFAYPYFRIMNPWSQSIRFDSQAEYIKKWVPELKIVPAKDIHNWEDTYNKWLPILKKDGIKYFKPIVPYAESRKKALSAFEKALK